MSQPDLRRKRTPARFFVGYVSPAFDVTTRIPALAAIQIRPQARHAASTPSSSRVDIPTRLGNTQYTSRLVIENLIAIFQLLHDAL